MRTEIRYWLLLVAAGIASGCAVEKTTPPPLAGPSEMSLSLAISANPDVLSLDGSSQALITVDARDHNGQPAANVALRVETLANGQAVDYGTLSARNLVTGSNGRATVTYTAPAFVTEDIPELNVSITPTGIGDAANQLRRLLTIRLVAPGVIIPGGLTASFSTLPDQPVAHEDVLFDASQSRAGVGTGIVSYRWDFGDGSSGSGRTTSHRYSSGTYTATLTVTDSNGLTASSSKILVINPGTAPTAIFVFSPTGPEVGRDVFFNAGQSTAGPGRRIVSYRWNWGDGTSTSSGVTRTHQFSAPASYVVVLTVTDDVGQIGTLAQTVGVCPVGGCEEEDDDEEEE